MKKTIHRFLAAVALACPPAALAQGVPPRMTPAQPGPEQLAPVVPGTNPFPGPPAPPVVAPHIETLTEAEPATYAFPLPAYPLTANHFWIGGDFFLAKRQGTDVPPLVTLAPLPPGNPTPGALGRPDTTIAFGNRRLNDRFGPGLRVNVGMFLGDCNLWSIDGNMTALREGKETFTAYGTPTRGVFVPVASDVPGGPVPFGFPLFYNLANASVVVDTQFIGADANLRYGVVANDETRIDLMVGYRYMQLKDGVTLTTTGANPFLGLGAAFGGPTLDTGDVFKTRNDFHGVNLGVSGVRRLGERFTLQGRATVALGQTYSETQILGTSNFGPAFPLLAPGSGIFAQASNSGTYRSNRFAVVPEVGIQLGYDLTARVRATFGYTYQYWSKVRRAAEQIDTTTGIAGVTTGRPLFPDKTTDFSVQGMTFGAELRY